MNPQNYSFYQEKNQVETEPNFSFKKKSSIKRNAEEFIKLHFYFDINVKDW
jgi:hypothetical protein